MNNWERFLTNKLEQDCPSLDRLKIWYFNLDLVRKDLWPQLRSTDLYFVYGRIRTRQLISEFIEVSDFGKILNNLKSRTKRSQDIEKVKRSLYSEYREKLFESFIVASMFLEKIGGEVHLAKIYLIFRIVLCNGKKRNIRELDFLRARLRSVIGSKGKCFIQSDIGFKNRNFSVFHLES